MKNKEITVETLSRKRKEDYRWKGKSEQKTSDKQREYCENWAKSHQYQYQLALSVYNQADLIVYLDSLESLKPYICNLIRKEMKQPYVETSSKGKRYRNNKKDRKRLFNIKFSLKNDKDILDYLETKSSIRSYLIGLLEQDMIDTGYTPTKEIEEYNKTHKMIAESKKNKVCKSIYKCLEEQLASGKDTIEFTKLYDYVRNEVDPNLSSRTYTGYRAEGFKKTGVLKVIKSTTEFQIDKDALEKLADKYKQ